MQLRTLMTRSLAGAAMVFATLALAPGAAQAEITLAAVDIQAVLDGSVAGKAALKEMEASANKEKGIIEKKVAELEKLQSEIETQQAMMRPETREEKTQQLQKLKREFELYTRDTQANFQRTRGKIMRDLYTGIKDVINAYAQEKKLTLIIEKGAIAAGTGPIFLYTDATLDVTAEVIKRFDLAASKKK